MGELKYKKGLAVGIRYLAECHVVEGKERAQHLSDYVASLCMLPHEEVPFVAETWQRLRSEVRGSEVRPFVDRVRGEALAGQGEFRWLHALGEEGSTHLEQVFTGLVHGACPSSPRS